MTVYFWASMIGVAFGILFYGAFTATVHMDMVRHYVSVDPLVEVDPSFVSLEVV